MSTNDSNDNATKGMPLAKVISGLILIAVIAFLGSSFLSTGDDSEPAGSQKTPSSTKQVSATGKKQGQTAPLMVSLIRIQKGTKDQLDGLFRGIKMPGPEHLLARGALENPDRLKEIGGVIQKSSKYVNKLPVKIDKILSSSKTRFANVVNKSKEVPEDSRPQTIKSYHSAIDEMEPILKEQVKVLDEMIGDLDKFQRFLLSNLSEFSFSKDDKINFKTAGVEDQYDGYIVRLMNGEKQLVKIRKQLGEASGKRKKSLKKLAKALEQQ